MPQVGASQNEPPKKRRKSGDGCVVHDPEVVAQPSENTCQQPRDLHLADPELTTDLLLGQTVDEPQPDDPTFALAEPRQRRTQPLGPLHFRVRIAVVGQTVAERQAGVGAGGCIQR